MASCALCDCRHFVPNKFRKTLCLKCFHGYSSHSGKPTVRYYLAKIEGGFSWEQMRHWYTSGLFNDPEKILVCAIDEEHDSLSAPPGSVVPFRLMSEAFPDPTRSFIPKDSPERPARPGVVRQLSEGIEEHGAASAAVVRDPPDTIASKVAQSSSAASRALSNGDAPAIIDEDEGAEVDGLTTDALSPSVARARADDMGRFFRSGNAWYFIDSSGKTQGPFSGEQMDAWFRAGYLWQKSLLIAQHGESAYHTLEALLAKATTVPGGSTAAASSVPAVAALSIAPSKSAAPSTATSSSQTKPSSIQSKSVSGPKSSAAVPSVAKATTTPAVVGGGSKSALSVKASASPVPAANASSAPAPSTAAVAAPVVPSSATPTLHLGNPAQLRRYVDALEWLYIDEAGRTQGPFKAVQMADWTEHGYFTDDTRLHALGGLMPEGTFLPLGEIFPDPGESATDAEIAETLPFESTSFVRVLSHLFGTLRDQFA